MISPRVAAEHRRAEMACDHRGGGGGFTARISSKIRPQDPGGGATRIAVPREVMDMEVRRSSVSSVVAPQPVPSLVVVVLVEEAEVRSAECLASAPVDKDLRLLAGATCPASMNVCKDGVIVPGVDGALSSSDLAGILFPAVPAGIPFSVDPVGPVGPYGTLSPSDSDSVGPVGPDGTLSSTDLAGILCPAVPAGIPFPVCPVGPVGHVGLCGTLSPSDSDSVGLVGPDGTLSSSDLAEILFPAVSAGIPFPVGPVSPVGPSGTLSPSDLENAGVLECW